MFAWCNILYNILNINSNTLDVITNSDNLFKDVFMNSSIFSQLNETIQLHMIVFNMLNKYDLNYKNKKVSKYDILKLNENRFRSKESKIELTDLFEKTQFVYFYLTRFVNLCKEKISKRSVTTDLALNDITLNNKNVISIYQNNFNYSFTIRDLINICNSALLFSHEFFSDPHIPKNPYTNVVFDQGILLKIYNSIRYSNYKMPVLYELFYKVNFNIDEFLLKYEVIIRDECINHFIKYGDIDEKCDYIRDILSIYLKKFRPKLKMSIHDDFPKKILSEAFQPILYNYLISEYSLLPGCKRWEKLCLMKYMLYKFVNNNPAFGRKKILINNKNKETFITDYIAVNKNINLPKETEEEKEFFVCIHEYVSENEDKDDDTITTESSSRNTNSSGMQLRSRSENYDNNNETESNDESELSNETESNDETDSNDVNIILSSDNSSLLDSAIHPELIMDDISQIRDEREYEELINDTDSVS